MSVKRLGVLAACVLGLAFALGTAQAGAAGPTKVMTFSAQHVLLTWVPVSGKGSPHDAVTTIGSSAVLTGRFYNLATQFGKAPGTAVGRILLDCRILNVPTDGLCAGIVHVPDGFFLIGGNGPFVPSPRHYAITGGAGPYANARGQVTITTTAQGKSMVKVSLYT